MVAWRMTIQPQELRDGEEFDFALEDAQVSYAGLGAQFDIYIQDAAQAGLKITITTPFRIGEAERPLSEPIDPEKDDPRIGKLILSLRRKKLVLCHVDPDGTLKLRFDDGLVIVVEPDPEYEAWELDHARFKIVGAAGGELAIWER
jgi:hypothetical protein